MARKCDDFKDLLSGFLDNHLNRREVILLEEHLKICLDCQEELKELESLKTLFQHHINSRPYPKASPHFADQVLESLKQEKKKKVLLPNSRLSSFYLGKIREYLTIENKWRTAASVLLFLLTIGASVYLYFGENNQNKLAYDLKASTAETVSLHSRNNLEDYLEEYALRSAQYPLAANKGLVTSGQWRVVSGQQRQGKGR